jgi:hypothetical protein
MISIDREISLNQEPRNLHIDLGTEASLVFHSDGKVTLNGNIKPDKAAEELIKILLNMGWLKIAQNVTQSSN